jgi:hypothetical protein
MIQRLLLLLIVVFLVGCQKDEINTYTAQRVEKAPAQAAPEGKAGEARTLGAMIPDNDGWWVFKLQSEKELADKQAEAFDRLIRTVRLTGKQAKPIEWTLPDGWTEQEPTPRQQQFGRVVTLRPKDSPLVEVAVSQARGSLLDNVNRWRGEVGLKPVAAAELEQATKSLDVNGVKVTIVDVSGPLAPKRGPMGMGR